MKHKTSHLAALAIALTLCATAKFVQADSAPSLKQIADGFTSPLNLLTLDDGSSRLLIGDQSGVVRILNKDGKLAEKPFLDLRSKMAKLPQAFDERGLLGIALHPQFKQNKKLYIFYSAPLRAGAPTNFNCTSHLSEFKMKTTDEADIASERVLMKIDKPQMNHNGGRITFGTDGLLYIGVGDGGAANDLALGHSPQGNGQDKSKLLGKILRIDIDKGSPYAIPTDNPFVGQKSVRPEIYATGLRNPWGISFDRGGTHELFVADVGQNRFEEVNIIIKGGNYGWNMREGFTCFDPKKPNSPPEDCPKTDAEGKPLIDPIIAYKNFGAFRKDPESRGISVTGGYVYRGKAIPQLHGKYIFADWSKNWAKADGTMFVATRPESSTDQWKLEPLELASHPKGNVPEYIVSFGEDSEGELYVMTNNKNGLMGNTGKVFKLVP
jgi:glucose/arabinose dehydrogenase